MPRHWLFKSEPGVYSIHDLARDGRTGWNGVRNYQVRNFLRDEIRPKDRVLFYHSSSEPPGVAGLAVVASSGTPDLSAQDPASEHYDEKATKEEPRWYQVDLAFEETFARLVPLRELATTPGLEQMLVHRKSRLSIQPVTPEEFRIVVALGRRKDR
ncbi:MAG: EVE domain-containing protein [Planctomycetes bacterium]|nr:EVE domain-containing protein [Planctomycetota bacterium]